MKKRANGVSASVRDALVQALVEKYELEPLAVETALPEVAELLKEQLPGARRKSGSQRFFALTLAEEKARRESLARQIAKFRAGRVAFSREEALSTLEDVASLVEAFPLEPLGVSEKDLAKLLKIASGLSLSKKQKPQEAALGKGEPARSISVLRGVRLNLTWDKKLLSVEIEPKQLALRDRALAFVGIGKDGEPDVAVLHDEYIWNDPRDE